LTADHIQHAFAAEKVSFGAADSHTVYACFVTLWAIISQALLTGAERSCRAAVIRVAVYFALLGRQVSTNSGAYCRARAKVGEAVMRRLAAGVAERAETLVPQQWKWLGKTVRLADGSDFSMPDTEDNQAKYPQSKVQHPGVGFPLMRALVLVSLATGMVSAMATAPVAGKETGETALLRSVFASLKADEVIVGDRYFCSWFMLALLRQRGVDFVVRMHHRRKFDFRRGQRLGPKDHIVSWRRPQRPDWMSQDVYADNTGGP
jgi:putative transposase